MGLKIPNFNVMRYWKRIGGARGKDYIIECFLMVTLHDFIDRLDSRNLRTCP